MVKFLNFFLISVLLLVSQQVFACTIFYVVDDNGHVLVGRNFDDAGSGGRIWFVPANDENNGIAILERMGVDMPYEGINDKGLFIGIAAVPDTRTPFSIFKPIRKSLEMVRIVLERAQTVDEALEVFSDYSIAFGTFLGFPVVHYMIVDKDGNAAIVEYVDNEIVIIKDPVKSQIMTNHFISHPKLGVKSEALFERFYIVKENIGNIRTIKDVQNLLRAASQNTTIWSNVYDLSNQEIYVSYKNSQTVVLSLKDELYRGKHGYSLSNLNKADAVLKYRQSDPRMIVRPHFGSGYIEGKSTSHYGIRILFPADDGVKRYGIEITSFDEFFTAGIILEQRLFGWFNMSIGTVGYFNYGEDPDNVVGLTSNLGWEPDNHIPFKPFVTYRSDVIFVDPVKVINSISIGFNFEF